jgi:uncharacterized membrane protein
VPAIPPGEIADRAMRGRDSGWTLAWMERGSDRAAGGKARRYRITVRGELTQSFVEPLGAVFVESTGDESILGFEVADQARLQAVFEWLYGRGVEIVSVVPVPRHERGLMAKPMFFYAGIYGSSADAEMDYAAVKALHGRGAIGSYDSAIVVHCADGEVNITKTEQPTLHGVWIGVAAGAAAAVVFPLLHPAVGYAGMAGAGAGLGAWFAHLAHGTGRGEPKDIGAMLEPGSAALVVIGIDIDAEAIERAAEHAREHTLKREFGDWDEAEHDDLESIARAEQQAMTP